jgi:uncharacterized protein (TIGR02001 family)
MTIRSTLVVPFVAATAIAFAAGTHAQTTAPTPAPAAAAAPAEAKPPEPPYTLTGNFGIYSQYIFRGLTQTDAKPAFQGGFDFTHESGFYLGTWGSNISWLGDAGACNHGCSLEWDFYGGWRKIWNEEWGLDLGVLQYYYPGSYNPGFSNPNTTELYIAGSWKWLSLKFSDSVSSKTFGTPNSRGSWYLDLTAAYPLTEQWTLIGHVGRQEYQGSNSGASNSVLNYTDWKLGATYTFAGSWSVGGYWTDTNTNGSVYTLAGKNIGKSTGTAFIQKTF